MKSPIAKKRATSVSALLFFTTMITACGAGMNRGTVGSATGAPARATADSSAVTAVNSLESETGPVGRSYGVTDEQNSINLQRLWTARTTDQGEADFPIGPGDLLEINAQYVEELTHKVVRVEGDGTVYLPLLGNVRAAGSSQAALSAEMAKRLRKYVYDPEIEVFVRQYHSHQVGVVGAVRNSGLFTLSDSKETVMDMLKEAGGTANDAGDAVILFPAADSNSEVQGGGSGLLPTAQLVPPRMENTRFDGQRDPQRDGRHRTAVPKDLQLVIIPLHATSLTSNSISLRSTQNFLRMPVRPGDLLLVPGGGDVMVIGWVRAPGRFHISPSQTVLETIAAAGGYLYASDQSNIQLIRTDPSGIKRTIPINLPEIIKGTSEDPLVFPNDVIEVPVSKLKFPPYVLYTMLTRAGLGVATGGMFTSVGGGGY